MSIHWLQDYYSRYKLYFQSASLYLLATLISSAIKIIINPVMARNLSHEDYAIIGYFGSFSILFLPLINFSIVTYYLSKYFTFPEEKRERVSNTILISLLGFGSFSSIIVLTGFYIYLTLNKIDFSFWPYAYFTVFQLVFNNFLTLLQVNYRLKRNARKFAALTIYSALLWLIISIILVVVLRLGARGSMGANLIVALLVGTYSFKRILTKIEFDSAVFKDALKFCWPLFLSAILWYFLSGVDRVFLEKLDDTKTFALYNIGIGLSGYFAIFYTALAQTFEPDIYKAISDKKINKLLKLISGIVLLNAIPVILFILMATPLTSILTGGRYTDAAGFARILSLKNISISLYYSVISVIVGFGHTKAELGLRALGAVISIIMFKFLIEKFGFYGAAWGQVFSFLLMAIIGASFIHYKLRFSIVRISNK